MGGKHSRISNYSDEMIIYNNGNNHPINSGTYTCISNYSDARIIYNNDNDHIVNSGTYYKDICTENSHIRT